MQQETISQGCLKHCYHLTGSGAASGCFTKTASELAITTGIAFLYIFQGVLLPVLNTLGTPLGSGDEHYGAKSI